MSCILAIDSGNTLIKWGLHDGCNWLIQDKVAHGNISSLTSAWHDLPQLSSIIVSHVANDLIKEELSELLSIWEITPYWIISLPFQCGVRNCYTDPALLGCDRWAALIAAWNLHTVACLVVNVGTAITVDVLSDFGDFLGGIILPGPSLMLETIQVNTALLSSELGKFENFPVSTSSATYSGVIQASLGAIERMQRLLCATLGTSVTVNCIVSGGGASLILPHVNFPVRVIDNLVLEGLVTIASDLSKH